MLPLSAVILALALLAWLLTGTTLRDDVTERWEREVMTRGLRKGGS